METGQIYGALASVMKAIKAVEKAERNAQQGFNFRGIDTVMNELHGLLAAEGVVILPDYRDYQTETIETARGGRMVRTHVTAAFRFVAMDGSSVTVSTFGEAMDSGDKSMNKAMSAALKYALLQMFLVPTKDMPDADRESPVIASAPALDDTVMTRVRCVVSVDELRSVYERLSAADRIKYGAVFTQRKKELQH